MAFSKHKNARRRSESAIAAVKGILPLDLDPAHKRRFLSLAIWKLTEAEGLSKFKTRFQSQISFGATKKDLRHEHVFPRKKMITDLINSPNRVDEILAEAVACVVTKDEHDQLNRIDKKHPELNGWERYAKAGIIVIDMETNLPAKFYPPPTK